jgi:hypothetical protein
MPRPHLALKTLRLKSGPWLDAGLRLMGLALLLLALLLADRLRHASPDHFTTPWAMSRALIAVLIFWLGNVLLIAGDALLRPLPRPPRPLQ